MDLEAVVQYTKLTSRTIYNLVSTGKIPYRRVNGKKVQFDRGEIDAWMKTRRTRRTSPKSTPPAQKSIEAAPISASPSSAFPSVPSGPSAVADTPQSVSSRRPHTHHGFRSVLGSAALIAVAVIAGRLFLSKHRVADSIPATSSGIPVDLKANLAKINYVDFIPSGEAETPAAGTVQIKIDYLSRPMEIQGQVGSPQIKSLLLEALKNENEEYAIKSKSIDIVQPYYSDPEIREVLLSILSRDKDPVIRMKTMTVLSKIAGNREIKKALIDRLKNDENIGVRYKALELIENDVDAEIMGLLRILMDKETNRIIRERAGSIYEAHLGTQGT